MLAFLAAAFPTLASWINLIIGWFTARAQAQSEANQAEANAEADHQNDGAQSVADQVSSDAQNAALDQIAHDIDHPPVATVEEPKK